MAVTNSLDLTEVFSEIDRLMAEKTHILVAIDGPCASGKSTLAAQLAEHYSAPLIHTDDFFLPPEKRTAERLAQIGGNVDSARFWDEVLRPLTQCAPLRYRPWRCKLGVFDDEISISPAPLTIVEGAYTLHPDVRSCYDLRIFLTAPLPLREERILHRNGPDGLIQFQNKWIPLENRYFECALVEQCCHIVLSFAKS